MNTDARVTESNKVRLAEIADKINQHLTEDGNPYLNVGPLLIEAKHLFQKEKDFINWCNDKSFRARQSTLHEYMKAAEVLFKHEKARQIECYMLRRIGSFPEDEQKEIIEEVLRDKPTRDEFREKYRKNKFKFDGEKIKKAGHQCEILNQALPEPMLQKVERAKRAEIARLQLTFDYEVDQKVAEIKSKLKEEKEALRLEKLRYEKLNSDFTTLMTMDEYKLIRGCLHPDRARDDQEKEKLNMAFVIFNRLQKTVDKHLPIAELRNRGWDRVSPFYKPQRRSA